MAKVFRCDPRAMAVSSMVSGLGGAAMEQLVKKK
jgi:hypothetical protein